MKYYNVNSKLKNSHFYSEAQCKTTLLKMSLIYTSIIKIIIILLSFQRLRTLSCFEKEAWDNFLGVLQISSDRSDRRIVWGLKFFIPRFFGVRKFCKLICLGRNFFVYSKQTEDSW